MKKLSTILLSIVLICAICVNTMAVDVLSPAQSLVPKLVLNEGEDGTDYYAIITQVDGNKVYIGPDTELQLLVTPYSEVDSVPFQEIGQMMKVAYNEMEEANDLSVLNAELITALQNFQKTTTDPLLKSLTVEDLIVTAFFDVSIVRDNIKLEELQDGETITFQFQTDFKPDDFFRILVKTGETWNIVEQCVVGENGIVTITLSAICPFAFIALKKNAEVKPKDPNAPTSPQTGEEIPFPMIGAACIVTAGTIVFLVSKRKKHTA